MLMFMSMSCSGSGSCNVVIQLAWQASEHRRRRLVRAREFSVLHTDSQACLLLEDKGEAGLQ